MTQIFEYLLEYSWKLGSSFSSTLMGWEVQISWGHWDSQFSCILLNTEVYSIWGKHQAACAAWNASLLSSYTLRHIQIWIWLRTLHIVTYSAKRAEIGRKEMLINLLSPGIEWILISRLQRGYRYVQFITRSMRDQPFWYMWRTTWVLQLHSITW